MKYKYLVCALIYVGLCSIDCYFSNVPMLNSIGQMGITEDVIFLNIHNSGSNFCGIKEILVVDTIPVLLGIYYALDKEKTYICLLYTSDAADEKDSVDLCCLPIIKKKKKLKRGAEGETNQKIIT